MRPNIHAPHLPLDRMPQVPRQPGPEGIDLEDAAAVKRALSLHRAGKAVFAVPFGSAGDGTLTWLDPREHQIADQGGAHTE